jgi:hypothetical protein
VTYLFTVLPAAGWNIGMFDAADELLPWLDANRRVYQLLRLLYFASQGLLLAVAWLVEARLVGRATCDGRRGDCGGAHRHGRACRALRRRPVIASAYVDASATGSVESQRTLLVLHDVFADVGKFLRLGPGARGLARVPPRHRVPRPRRRSARRLRTSRRRRAATSDGSGAPVSGGSHALAVTSATTLRAAGLDVVCVRVFAAVGQHAHDDETSLLAIAVIAWPFLAGLALSHLVTHAWPQPAEL